MNRIQDALKDFLGNEWEVHLFDREKQKRREYELKAELPQSGDPSGIPKKNAWIVWLSDENQYITDLQVYELDPILPHRWEKIVRHVNDRMTEKKTPYRDCGRVNSDWDEWDLSDVLFKFGMQYAFRDRNIMVKCMKRLATIEEFKDRILGWMKFVGNE